MDKILHVFHMVFVNHFLKNNGECMIKFYLIVECFVFLSNVTFNLSLAYFLFLYYINHLNDVMYMNSN